jgi:hypothetical protein
MDDTVAPALLTAAGVSSVPGANIALKSRPASGVSPGGIQATASDRLNDGNPKASDDAETGPWVVARASPQGASHAGAWKTHPSRMTGLPATSRASGPRLTDSVKGGVGTTAPESKETSVANRANANTLVGCCAPFTSKTGAAFVSSSSAARWMVSCSCTWSELPLSVTQETCAGVRSTSRRGPPDQLAFGPKPGIRTESG